MSHPKNRAIETAIRHALLSATLAACACASVGLARAQVATAEAVSKSKSDSDGNLTLQEVVVTGTLIRGVAPVGTQLITITPQNAVAAIGAVGTDQVLANVPEIGNYFNSPPQVPTGSVAQLQITRPNLLNLPNANTSSGSATLVLLDGHRIVGAGVNEDAPDPDVIPTIALQRVEIMPAGGSSTYGSDAVGGVINFITRQHVNGIETNARYGFAKDYKTLAASALAGHDWGNFSGYVAYEYSMNTALNGVDRGYVRDIDWTTGIPAGRQCASPNVQITKKGVTQIYAVPGLQPGTFNACDPGREATIYPEQERHSFFGHLGWQASDALAFDATGFYTLKTAYNDAPQTGTVNITPANPYYENIPSAPGATQAALFDFSPISGEAGAFNDDRIKEWGVTTTATADLGPKWQLRGLLNYGQSETSYALHSINPTLLKQSGTATTAATAIDPYDIAATDPALISSLENWYYLGDGKSEMLNARIVADGSLFRLPGGDVHLAGGAEFIRNAFKDKAGQAVAGGLASMPYSSYTQKDKAVFGELNVPIVGSGNSHLLLRSLSVDASARYDDYNEFGSTTNPRVGVNYGPVDWITVRGNWGKSFNAPTPVDELGSLNNQILAYPFAAAVPPGQKAPPGEYTVSVQGSRPDLQPQTASIYSIGADIKPPFISGLVADITYYYIRFDGLLGNPPVFNPSLFIQNYPSFYTLNPTAAQIAAFGNLAPGGAATVAPFLQPGGPIVYELIDFRTTNLGNAKIGGLNYSLKYTHATGFGSVDGSFTGNYQIEETINGGGGTPYVDQLATGVSRLRAELTLGANIGSLRAQATLDHSSGYAVTRSATLLQDNVGSFNVVNLFFGYHLRDAGWSRNMAVTLGIYNVLDRDPPLYMYNGASPTSTYGYVDSTVGRMFELGLSKGFGE